MSCFAVSCLSAFKMAARSFLSGSWQPANAFFDGPNAACSKSAERCSSALYLTAAAVQSAAPFCGASIRIDFQSGSFAASFCTSASMASPLRRLLPARVEPGHEPLRRWARHRADAVAAWAFERLAARLLERKLGASDLGVDGQRVTELLLLRFVAGLVQPHLDRLDRVGRRQARRVHPQLHDLGRSLLDDRLLRIVVAERSGRAEQLVALVLRRSVVRGEMTAEAVRARR